MVEKIDENDKDDHDVGCKTAKDKKIRKNKKFSKTLDLDYK
jgi:hypothetical protein